VSECLHAIGSIAHELLMNFRNNDVKCGKPIYLSTTSPQCSRLFILKFYSSMTFAPEVFSTNQNAYSKNVLRGEYHISASEHQVSSSGHQISEVNSKITRTGGGKQSEHIYGTITYFTVLHVFCLKCRFKNIFKVLTFEIFLCLNLDFWR
jgi:endoglucanase Acf2